MVWLRREQLAVTWVAHEEGHVPSQGWLYAPRKVDMRLPGKENSNSHDARPVHQIISMMKWIRTSRLSIKNSFSTLLRNGLDNLTFTGRQLETAS